MPDERCRILRRRLARREQLMRSRTRVKNEVHACLQRRLQEKPPCSDLFGVKGRQWLGGLELPLEERETVDAAIRQIEFLDAEVSAVDHSGSRAEGHLGASILRRRWPSTLKFCFGHPDPGVCFVSDFEPTECLPEGFLGGYIGPGGEKLDRVGDVVIGALHSVSNV